MNDTVFRRHRHPKQESWQHCYRPFGTAAVTRRDNTAAVRSGNAAHREGCTGKNPHVIHDDVALCRRQTWQRCILSGIQRTHTPSIYMHTYVLVSSRAPWHRLLGQRSLMQESQGECSSSAGTYNCTSVVFLGNKVLCFFFSVTACYVLLIICTCLCPTFFCAYRINSYCSLLYLRVFVHTFIHCTVPCVPSRVSHHRLCLGTVIWLH